MYKGYGLKLSDRFVQSRVLTEYGRSIEQMHSFGQSEYKQVVEAAKAGIAGFHHMIVKTILMAIKLRQVGSPSDGAMCFCRTRIRMKPWPSQSQVP